MDIMILEDAIAKLEPLINKRLRELISEEQMSDIIRAKGRTGQLLETLIGLKTHQILWIFKREN